MRQCGIKNSLSPLEKASFAKNSKILDSRMADDRTMEKLIVSNPGGR